MGVMELEHTLNAYFKRNQLTKEQLRFITDYRSECITQAILSLGYLQRKFGPSGSSNVKPWMFKNHFDEIFESDEYASLLCEQMQDQRVIELGPGFYPEADMLFEKFGIAEYVAVEPINFKLTEAKLDMKDPRIRVVREDSLSYLLRQPNNSAIVISCGVICLEYLQFAADNPDISYFRFLGKEMQRVTPTGTLTIHETNLNSNQRGTNDENINLVFIKNGFKPYGAYNKNVFVKP